MDVSLQKSYAEFMYRIENVAPEDVSSKEDYMAHLFVKFLYNNDNGMFFAMESYCQKMLLSRYLKRVFPKFPGSACCVASWMVHELSRNKCIQKCSNGYKIRLKMLYEITRKAIHVMCLYSEGVA